jgi:hypothetical protein
MVDLIAEAETFSQGHGQDDEHELPEGVQIMATVNAQALMATGDDSLPLQTFNDLSVVDADPAENEVFIGSSVVGSPELYISTGASGVDITDAIQSTTSTDMGHLVINWFSIIDNLEALRDTNETLDLEVVLEMEEGDQDGPPIFGWDIQDMELFKSFDASTLVEDAENPYAPLNDPNYIENSIWKTNSDGSVLVEIQGGLVARDGEPLTSEQVGLFIADLFIDANDEFAEIV